MSVRTILVPTDGSEPAETAARRGFEFATQLDAAVHVLSVSDSSVGSRVSYSKVSPTIRERLAEQARDRAASLRDVAVERGLDATAATRDGLPAEEIVEYAGEHGIDAIVMGTSGRGGVARAIIGSVADKVVRTASMPVMTITPEAADDGTLTVDSILLPTDGSETATAGLRWGLSLAEQCGATAHLFSAVDRDHANALSPVSGDDADPSTDLLEQARAHLDTLATEQDDRDVDVVTHATVGDPPEEIVEFVESEGIDLIAMGTHGRGGFDRALLGSVTDTVVRTAPVPVLSVRPDDAGR
ncbi:MAG: universal stress protein [Halovenus sp.]